MKTYIDKAEALGVISTLYDSDPEHNKTLDKAHEAIVAMPTADVAPVQRWIPVRERLPEDFKAVLVYTPKFLNQFMAYRKDDGWRVWSPQDNHGVPFINGQGEITHWMPLPKAPEEE